LLTPNGSTTYVMPVGAETFWKAAVPSTAVPERKKAVSTGPAVSAADGAQPEALEMKEAPVAQGAHGTPPNE